MTVCHLLTTDKRSITITTQMTKSTWLCTSYATLWIKQKNHYITETLIFLFLTYFYSYYTDHVRVMTSNILARDS